MDHTEVRELFKDLLAPIILQNEHTNKTLTEIKDRLTKLNGSVASHEKIINKNLPHNISLCTQVETIEKIKDNMIGGRAVKSAIIIGISSASAIAGIIFIIYKVATQS